MARIIRHFGETVYKYIESVVRANYGIADSRDFIVSRPN